MALGCEIGNHAYEHNILTRLNGSQIQSVIAKTNQAVKKVAGVDIRVMRPPGGDNNSTVLANAGMPLILWTFITLDWMTRDRETTISYAKDKAQDGAIVLMHDLHKSAGEVADSIVKYLNEQGYQLVTISEMAAYRGGMSAGRIYSEFKK